MCVIHELLLDSVVSGGGNNNKGNAGIIVCILYMLHNIYAYNNNSTYQRYHYCPRDSYTKNEVSYKIMQIHFFVCLRSSKKIFERKWIIMYNRDETNGRMNDTISSHHHEWYCVKKKVHNDYFVFMNYIVFLSKSFFFLRL